MLTSLTIQDIVLIERLAIALGPGLTVLTGETGAGKSILLDSLGLALGARGDAGLVREGAAQGSVAASFELPGAHPARALLAAQAIPPADELILRRVIGKDGRSKAFVNDQPVGVGFLRQIGDLLVEVHGQHDDRGLLDASGHRELLDLYAGAAPQLTACRKAYAAWRDAKADLAAAENRLAEIRQEEDYLRHAIEELRQLDPQPGEEQELAEARASMLRGQSVHEGLADILGALNQDNGVDAVLRGCLRQMERLAERAGEELEGAIKALDRAAIETGEAVAKLEETIEALSFDPLELEHKEERLFEIRAMARKYQCPADGLAEHRDRLVEKLAAIEGGAEALGGLETAMRAARGAFETAVATLGKQRAAAAAKLDQTMAKELPPLKLEKARFRTVLEPLDPVEWTGEGGERVRFEVATNPGASFGPLIKIASGGELARFILALKVSLAATGAAVSMIFDEVDRGIGGSTASAVGSRLAALAKQGQVLVVTHSPQVAARGRSHLRIEKQEQKGCALTRVGALDADARREEIARMLSGAHITDAARAAALSLLKDASESA